MDVEPTLADCIESGFDDLFKSSNPSSLPTVVADSCDARSLNLLELIDSSGLWVRDVEDLVLLEKSVAFSSDFNHGLDGFLFDVKRLEAEIGELLWEVMLWDWHHTEVWGLSWRLLLRELKISGDHVSFGLSGFKCSLHDDFVHGSGEVLVDLVHDTGGVYILS